MKTTFQILDLPETQIEYLSDDVASSVGGGNIGREPLEEFKSCVRDLVEAFREGEIDDLFEQWNDCREDFLLG